MVTEGKFTAAKLVSVLTLFGFITRDVTEAANVPAHRPFPSHHGSSDTSVTKTQLFHAPAKRRIEKAATDQQIIVNFDYKIELSDVNLVDQVEGIIADAQSDSKEELQGIIDAFFDQNEFTDEDILLNSLDMKLIGPCDDSELCFMGNGIVSLNYTDSLDEEFLFSTIIEETQIAIASYNEELEDVFITYLGPLDWNADIYVTLQGVPPREMNANDQEVFGDSLSNFLSAQLSETFGESFSITNVFVVTQDVSTRRKLQSQGLNANLVLARIEGMCGDTCPSIPDPEDIMESIELADDELIADFIQTIADEVGSGYFDTVETVVPAPVEVPPFPKLQPIPTEEELYNEKDDTPPRYIFYTLAAPAAVLVILIFLVIKRACSRRKGMDYE